MKISIGNNRYIDYDYNEQETAALDTLSRFDIRITPDLLRRITLWKLDRVLKIDEKSCLILESMRKYKQFDGNCKEATRNVLSVLFEQKGVGLPMASTYLRFINPEVFPIIDVRALRAAFDYNPAELGEAKFPNLATAKNRIDIYIKYVERLNMLAEDGYHGMRIAFGDLDRVLYVIDQKLGLSLDADAKDANIERLRDMVFLDTTVKTEI